MNKLKFSVLAAFLFLSYQINAQSKGTVGFSFTTISSNAMLRSGSLEHNYETIKGKGFMAAGIDYWYPLTDWLKAETGINYSFQNFSKLYYNPNIYTVALTAVEPVNFDIHQVNIPVGFRAEFLKYGFINSGVLLDLTHEPGIGSYFGIGAKIESEIGLGLMINPYVKMHSVLPVSFNKDADRVMEAGIKFGITYSLDYLLKK